MSVSPPANICTTSLTGTALSLQSHNPLTTHPPIHPSHMDGGGRVGKLCGPHCVDTLVHCVDHTPSPHSDRPPPPPPPQSRRLTVTLGLHLAGGQARLAALDAHLQVLALAAARRVLVAAHGAVVLPQLAVLVAAGVLVLGADQAGVTLLLALDAQVTAE